MSEANSNGCGRLYASGAAHRTGGAHRSPGDIAPFFLITSACTKFVSLQHSESNTTTASDVISDQEERCHEKQGDMNLTNEHISSRRSRKPFYVLTYHDGRCFDLPDRRQLMLDPWPFLSWS
jgi:hypothetical protein